MADERTRALLGGGARRGADATTVGYKPSLKLVLICALGVAAAAVAVLRRGALHAADAALLQLSARESDRVTSLPGADASLLRDHRQYAGYVNVDEQADSALFYWFAESSRVRSGGEDASKIPLIIWFNGGPGASSMTGWLTEGVGPLLISADGTSLRRNPHSWHRLAHVLAWDQPVGSGYSYTRAGAYADSMEAVSSQLVKAMAGFYERHPAYRSCAVYLVGESFAGKYVPFLAHHLHVLNSKAGAKGEEWVVPLAGLAVGNGVFRPLLQYGAVAPVAQAFGYIDDSGVARVDAALRRCEAALAATPHDAPREAYHRVNSVCDGVESEAYDSKAAPFIYDVRVTASNPFARSGSVIGCLGECLGRYLNRDDVRDALHVTGHEWVNADGGMKGNQPSRHLEREQASPAPRDARLGPAHPRRARHARVMSTAATRRPPSRAPPRRSSISLRRSCPPSSSRTTCSSTLATLTAPLATIWASRA